MYIVTFLTSIFINFLQSEVPLDEAEATKVVKESAREARRKIEDLTVFMVFSSLEETFIYVCCMS